MTLTAERDLLDRGKALMLYFYNIVTKPLLRHRVEQTGVSVILRRYGAAGRGWLERLFLRGGSPCLLYGGLSF